MFKKWMLIIFLGFFSQFNGEENFILIDGITGEIVREFGTHIDERVTPASSFKIALSLIGYDSGVLKDATEPMWPYQEGYDDFLEAWKCPQNPQTWITSSCIWYSKIISLQLGLERLQEYLALFEYGNQDLSAGIVLPGPIDPAWVSSSLKISPREQVAFIQKMVQEKLQVSNHAHNMTKAILFKELLPDGWVLYGKTGTGLLYKDFRVRWFVGWIEKDDAFFPFAYQIRAKQIDNSQTVIRAKQLMEESLKKKGKKKRLFLAS